ncbi:integrase [Rhodoblastus acidophilus]|uniref:site-specific integrase n=1 Tax=Rhodoblastus acidophilus TaxID=1074 RepID=UPI0022259FF1|nr:site-specific integrase [Rhodoblastus acidophilus]MCW2285681.1 integrase [Rhodoblastus acidophilus]MCW2333053.1 integrase [Rhodoblastus acidophilus]
MKNASAQKVNLTDRFLRALRPAPKGQRLDIWDAGLPNFGVRVTDATDDKGRASQVSFIVMRRIGRAGNPVRRVVGEWRLVGDKPMMTLAEARDKARAAIEDMKAGIDPTERRQAELRAIERAKENSFSIVAEAFITEHVSGLRSGDEVTATIRRELINAKVKTDDEPAFEGWGRRPVTSISRRDVIERIRAIKKGRPAQARLVLAYVRKLFNWAVAQEIYGLESSPCDKIAVKDLIGKPTIRDRTLDPEEVRALWAVTDWSNEAPGPIGYPFAPFVRLLLLTGQRLREVAEARWREFDLDAGIWIIPADRMKGGAAHEVPLPPMAIEILRSLPRGDAGDFVFSTTGGKRPISGFSKAKTRLDGAIAQHRQTSGAEEMPDWRFHDLRRTMRTGLSALPIPNLVAELVIAHAKPGLHKIYDLHAYRDEKRHALKLWEARLLAIVSPEPPSNVVTLFEAIAQ